MLEAVLAEESDRLEHLGAEGVGLDELGVVAVDLEEAGTLLDVSKGSGRLLAAKNLDRALSRSLRSESEVLRKSKCV